MDLATTFEIVGPIAVALLAVWLGFRYQLYALDRETRKHAYLDALLALLRLANLIQDREQLNFALWQLSNFARENGPDKPIGKAAEEFLASRNHWLVRSREICSRLGVEVDWSVIGDPTRVDLGDDLRTITSRFAGAVIRERERLRIESNRATLHAASVTQLGIFWGFVPRRSEVQLSTAASLHSTYRVLDGVLRSFELDQIGPHPVDWDTIDSALAEAQTAALTDLGTLGHMRFSLVEHRERPPWPPEILEESQRNRADPRTRKLPPPE